MIVLNNKIIDIERFPNDEIRIRNINAYLKEESLIELKYESSDDLIGLYFLKKKLDDNNIKSKLFIRYMPYSRMDREFENDFFLLKYITDFINSLNFSKVYVLEPHSKVTEELLNNIKPLYIMKDFIDMVKSSIGFNENDKIVFPDAGSYKRYGEDYDDYILFDKKRDENSTLIKTIVIKEGQVDSGSKCIIVDDLCASGNTCNKVAKILKENGAKEVYVLVTHTENQVLEKDLIKESYVDGIFTTDSLLTKKHDKIFILPYNKEQYLN